MSDSTGSVLSLVAQIVAAHVANHRIDPVDLPKLINDVHRALANAEQARRPRRAANLPLISRDLSAAITSFALSVANTSRC
jgi:predicted transcriptional regulator